MSIQEKQFHPQINPKSSQWFSAKDIST